MNCYTAISGKKKQIIIEYKNYLLKFIFQIHDKINIFLSISEKVIKYRTGFDLNNYRQV